MYGDDCLSLCGLALSHRIKEAVVSTSKIYWVDK